jgi:hypothetical protein
MILNQFKVDTNDIVALVSAMMVSNELEELVQEGEISRTPQSDNGEFYIAAKRALKLISKMHREHPEDWDGVVWYELLSQAGKGSLADRLVDLLVTDMPAKEEVRLVVIGWLKAVGI